MMEIRPAEKYDFDFFLELKSEDFNVFWVGAEEKPQYESLKKFFEEAIDKADIPQNRKIYIIENDEHIRVGHLYILPNGNEYDLPIAIKKDYCGRGYAKEAIRLGLEEGKRLGFKKMRGSIREDNIASLKAYTACGVRVLEEFYEVYIPKLGKTVKMNYVEYGYE